MPNQHDGQSGDWREALTLAKRALALAREAMMEAPPGIDPMVSGRVSKWREIDRKIKELEAQDA